MNPENDLRILESLKPKKVHKIQLLRGKIAHPILAASAPSIRDRHERRATRVRCALRALRSPPPFKKKGANFLEGCFSVAICSRGPGQAPEISRPGAPASAKFMAWGILNGKSLAWANEKYEKSSPERDFHQKNLLAWTSSNGKFLAWANEK